MATYNGTPGNNSYSGSSGNDILRGNGGNDTLAGNGGNDTVDGGTGNDTVRFRGAYADYSITWDSTARQYVVVDRTGRDGIDRVSTCETFRFADRSLSYLDLVAGAGEGLVRQGTAGADLLVGGLGYDLLQGGDGNDMLDGREAADTLEGGAGNDTLRGGKGDDSVLGGAGDDVVLLSGARSNYDIQWNAATRTYSVTDLFANGEGRDVMAGVEYFDFADGRVSIGELLPVGDGQQIVGTGGDDNLLGGVGHDRLEGLDGADALSGGAGNDVLEGGASSDTLTGGGGDDRIMGGEGTQDVVLFTGSMSDYYVAWDVVNRTFTFWDQLGNRDGFDVVSGVEVFGFADGWQTIETLLGGVGVWGPQDGTEQADIIVGNAGVDHLRGLGGDDVLRAFESNDTLEGGDDDDQLEPGSGDDLVDGGSGYDIVVFDGLSSQYDISWNAATREYTLADLYGTGGTDRVKNVELFQFRDGMRDIGGLIPGQGDGLRLTGTTGNDELWGGAGYDSLLGLEGNDWLRGLNSKDTLDGGEGDDNLLGGNGDDIIEGGSGIDTVRFDGWLIDYDISWNATTRQYTITDRSGYGGTDVVSGVEMFHFAGDFRDIGNLLAGEGDGQTVTGTEGDDHLGGGLGYDSLTGLDGNDTLEGFASNDTLLGGGGNDQIAGGDGHDIIEGGEGDDQLAGGEGHDTIQGGAGIDTLRFDGWSDEYDISWDGATRQYTITHRWGPGGTDVVSGVEMFQFYDGMRDIGNLIPGQGDGQTLTGTAGDDFLWGGPGYDSLRGLDGNDTLDGDFADDTLDGGTGDDQLAGGHGHDILHGGDGNDQLVGGDGSDMISGGAGIDTVRFDGWMGDYDISWNATTREYTIAHRWGSGGTDVVSGVEMFQFYDGMRDIGNLIPGQGDGQTLVGTLGDDYLAGGPGYDNLTGLDGNDVLEGFTANDTLDGGDGNDQLSGGDGHDMITGGAGIDTVRFDGWMGDYDIAWNATTRQYTIAHRWGAGGTDVVSGVEMFQFWDGVRDMGNLVPGQGDGQTLAGTVGDDYLWGGPGYDSVSGLEGNDTLEGFTANDTLDGGEGNDQLAGGDGHDVITGGAGIDTVRFDGWMGDYDIGWNAATREYTITHRWGPGGTDIVSGVEMFQFYDGVRDIGNLVAGQGDGQTLVGTVGDDYLWGGPGYDSVSGLDGNDTLEGFTANDTLDGGDGNDQLGGGDGHDVITGGAGIDSVRFDGWLGDYDISWNATTREYTIAHRWGSGGTDVVSGVEMFQFYDGMRDIGNLIPGQGDGQTLTGTTGEDYLWGGPGYDSVSGLEGNDTLEGFTANDTLDGGDGNDQLSGGDGHDVITGGAGIDSVRFDGWLGDYDISWNATTREYTIAHRWGSGGTDVVSGVEMFQFYDGMRDIGNLIPGQGDGQTLTGTTGEDYLWGGPGYDSVSGLEGNDTLEGFTANDTLDGGDGNDQLGGGDGHDVITGGAGIDTVRFDGWLGDYDISWNATTREYTIAHRWGSGGTDVVSGVEMFQFYDGMREIADLVPGQGEGQTLTGTSGNDLVWGSPGYDTLYGLEGNDSMDGSAADDTLDGGAGDDFLMGGGGSDVFILDGQGFDNIVDFGNGPDRLQLSGSLFAGLPAGALDPAVFQAGQGVEAWNADVRVIYDTRNATLFLDADGQGSQAPVLVAILGQPGFAPYLDASHILVG